jgi:hypothetical protein
MLELFYIVGVLLRFVWAAMVIVLLVVLVMAMLAGAAGELPVGGSNEQVMSVFRECGELVQSVRNSLPPTYN